MDDTAEMSSEASSNASENTREEAPKLLTLQDYGIAPLVNTVVDGKRIPELILAFPFTPDDQLRWADYHNIEPGVSRLNREMAALDKIREKMHRDYIICFIHYDEDSDVYDESMTDQGIIVTTNATQEDLDQARNIGRIRAIQELLRIPDPPFWARPLKF